MNLALIQKKGYHDRERFIEVMELYPREIALLAYMGCLDS